jgi:low affinity Fe/Cu permease
MTPEPAPLMLESSALAGELHRPKGPYSPDHRGPTKIAFKITDQYGRRALTFNRIARGAGRAAAHSSAFIGALLLIILWAATGPLVGYGDSWMLWVNTGTTIITFLMVFLLQHSQATADQALHAKLDELIKSQQGADNRLMRLEEEEAAAIEDIREAQAKDG